MALTFPAKSDRLDRCQRECQPGCDMAESSVSGSACVSRYDGDPMVMPFGKNLECGTMPGAKCLWRLAGLLQRQFTGSQFGIETGLDASGRVMVLKYDEGG